MEDKKPIATINMFIEFEVEYDSFNGRTLTEFGDLLEEELHEALHDFREEDVVGFFSKVESVHLIGQ